jgi:ABC-type antimicrobial peptide transport system, ATPase component
VKTSRILECSNLRKSYKSGEDHSEEILHGISMTISRDDCAILLGPSGSGKTTLLSILGCLLRPTSGELSVDGEVVDFSSVDGLTERRRAKIGFVFQHANLLPFLSVQENLVTVGRNAGVPQSHLRQKIDDLLNTLGLQGAAMKFPSQLSGGQRQRVALGRALVHSPSVILADEPTASLDWETGTIVTEMLINRARELRAALIVVTHDTRLIPRFNRVLRMESGNVIEISH